MTDYVLYPCRRASGPLPAGAGEAVIAADGNEIQFSVELEDNRIGAVSYRASSCATLVAYAEVLGEAVTGMDERAAMGVTPTDLVERLPGVPTFRQERAALVVHAWWSALARALESGHALRKEQH